MENLKHRIEECLYIVLLITENKRNTDKFDELPDSDSVRVDQ